MKIMIEFTGYSEQITYIKEMAETMLGIPWNTIWTIVDEYKSTKNQNTGLPDCGPVIIGPPLKNVSEGIGSFSLNPEQITPETHEIRIKEPKEEKNKDRIERLAEKVEEVKCSYCGSLYKKAFPDSYCRDSCLIRGEKKKGTSMHEITGMLVKRHSRKTAPEVYRIFHNS